MASIGSSLGVFRSARVIHDCATDHGENTSVHVTDRDRHRLLAETVWTNEPRQEPIVAVVAEQLAETEGVESQEQDPLYEHVDPGVVAKFRTQDDSQWQPPYTDEYEVRVSSHGTVTIYDTDDPDEA